MRSASKTALRKSGRMALKKANTEIEVKLRIRDGRRLLRQLARLKAKLTHARVHEMNTLYDTPDGNLARHGRMLRLRVERPAGRPDGPRKTRKTGTEGPEISALLTFKGPPNGAQASEPGRYKIREEHELHISDCQEVPKILEALGLRRWFRYEKYRTTFELPGMSRVKLVFDETPIGLFVELEGERGEINRAAELLGFARSDYINQSYGALFMQECGLARPTSQIEPTPASGLPDMLFRRSKGVSGADWRLAKQIR
jgi:adenylate cyclase, class 2